MTSGAGAVGCECQTGRMPPRQVAVRPRSDARRPTEVTMATTRPPGCGRSAPTDTMTTARAAHTPSLAVPAGRSAPPGATLRLPLARWPHG
jgi:hypothetical protein